MAVPVRPVRRRLRSRNSGNNWNYRNRSPGRREHIGSYGRGIEGNICCHYRTSMGQPMWNVRPIRTRMRSGNRTMSRGANGSDPPILRSRASTNSRRSSRSSRNSEHRGKGCNARTTNGRKGNRRRMGRLPNHGSGGTSRTTSSSPKVGAISGDVRRSDRGPSNARGVLPDHRLYQCPLPTHRLLSIRGAPHVHDHCFL